MPIPKSQKSTWPFEMDGTTFTLGPVDAEVAAKALGMAGNAERQPEALVYIARNGGVRGWTNEEETIERATSADLRRLTFEEAAKCGDEVFAKTFLDKSDSD